ncbi:hypothetical protein [Haliangium sp.]|uniref:hypothetical protein n=1 Tax=Haliangium sp. TaxID=2663208 RepID=UPI003D0AA110
MATSSRTSNTRRRLPSECRLLVCALAWAVTVAASPPARADDDDSAERRRAAGQAYAAAENAALAGDYARAAENFELAYTLVPSSQALRAALQMRNQVGHHRIAISQAEELLRRYPYDVTSRSLALEVLDQLSPRFVRAYVTCDGECRLRVDRRKSTTAPAREHILYLPPGRHTLVAVFDGERTTSKRIRRSAGEPIALSFSPPADTSDETTDGAPAPDQGAPEDLGAPLDLMAAPTTSGASTADEHDAVGTPPLLPLAIGGGLTAALGGVTVWSHRDAVSTGDESASTRTRILLGGTALAAAATMAVSVIWARLDTPDASSARAPDPATGGPALGLTGDSAGAWVGWAGSF